MQIQFPIRILIFTNNNCTCHFTYFALFTYFEVWQPSLCRYQHERAAHVLWGECSQAPPGGGVPVLCRLHGFRGGAGAGGGAQVGRPDIISTYTFQTDDMYVSRC